MFRLFLHMLNIPRSILPTLLSSQLFFGAVLQHDYNIFTLALGAAFTMGIDGTLTNAKVGSTGCFWRYAKGLEDLNLGHGIVEVESDDSGLLGDCQRRTVGSGCGLRSFFRDGSIGAMFGGIFDRIGRCSIHCRTYGRGASG